MCSTQLKKIKWNIDYDFISDCVPTNIEIINVGNPKQVSVIDANGFRSGHKWVMVMGNFTLVTNTFLLC